MLGLGNLGCPWLWGLTSGHLRRAIWQERKGCLCGGGRKLLTDEEGSVSPKGQGARPSKEREAGRGACRHVKLPRGNALLGCRGAALGNRGEGAKWLSLLGSGPRHRRAQKHLQPQIPHSCL